VAAPPKEIDVTPEQLARDAVDAAAHGQRMTLTKMRGQKMPAGFPRGELLCDTEHGKVYSFDPDKVIAWLVKNGLITA
jgi:hypothetical protein